MTNGEVSAQNRRNPKIYELSLFLAKALVFCENMNLNDIPKDKSQMTKMVVSAQNRRNVEFI